jgi:Icc-related predicted phosphoesterase
LHGDVLIHCGDGCNGFRRDAADIDRLDEWFGRHTFRAILYIGGNHDFHVQARAFEKRPVFENATYLQDQCFELSGLRFYGSPWLPDLYGWAFFLDEESRRKKWASIPDMTDVLITHTPPHGILDQNRRGDHCGCVELQARVSELRPRLHCFGHVHASAGMTTLDGTCFVNASMVNSSYEIARQPFVVELKPL